MQTPKKRDATIEEVMEDYEQYKKYKAEHFATTYCLCQSEWDPTEEDVMMIECEACAQWFHPQCVGISKEEAKKNKTGWTCSGCESDEHTINEFWNIVRH